MDDSDDSDIVNDDDWDDEDTSTLQKMVWWHLLRCLTNDIIEAKIFGWITDQKNEQKKTRA